MPITHQQLLQIFPNAGTKRIIDQATADAAAARTSADSLRGAADNLANRLAASDASGHSCTAAASQAAARAAMGLADVLKRVDERSGNLALYADQSHGRGVTCEQAYDGLGIVFGRQDAGGSAETLSKTTSPLRGFIGPKVAYVGLGF